MTGFLRSGLPPYEGRASRAGRKRPKGTAAGPSWLVLGKPSKSRYRQQTQREDDNERQQNCDNQPKEHTEAAGLARGGLFLVSSVIELRADRQAGSRDTCIDVRAAGARSDSEALHAGAQADPAPAKVQPKQFPEPNGTLQADAHRLFTNYTAVKRSPAGPLLVPERLDRVQPRRLAGGVKAEENSHSRREDHRHGN